MPPTTPQSSSNSPVPQLNFPQDDMLKMINSLSAQLEILSSRTPSPLPLDKLRDPSHEAFLRKKLQEIADNQHDLSEMMKNHCREELLNQTADFVEQGINSILDVLGVEPTQTQSGYKSELAEIRQTQDKILSQMQLQWEMICTLICKSQSQDSSKKHKKHKKRKSLPRAQSVAK